MYGWFKQRDDYELRVLNTIGNSVLASRAAGLVLSVDCALLLFGVCRNTITFLRQTWLNRLIPFEENLYFHRWTACSMLLFSVIHTNAHYLNFFIVQYQLPRAKLGNAWEIHYAQYGGITGHIMLFICFLMYTSSMTSIKRKNFEIFWYNHHLFIPFYFALFFHSKGCFVKSADTMECKGYNSNFATIPIFLLYCLERLYRHFRGNLSTQVTKVIFHAGNTMEIRFEKESFKFKPGQYLFLNVPSISTFQWHPFTISSTPEEGFVTLHIRIVGNWTRQLAEVIGCFKDRLDSSSAPLIRVDGPYGAPAEDLFGYKVAVLVGTGIGVTPAASLLKSVWYRYYRKAPMNLSKLYFFWVNRDLQAFSWFQSLLASLEETVPGAMLEIHTFLTGQVSADDIQNISLNHDSERDAITELYTKTHYGRPNWNHVLSYISSENTNISVDYPLEIGVFCCGPSALGKALKNECKKCSNPHLKFILRKEKF